MLFYHWEMYSVHVSSLIPAHSIRSLNTSVCLIVVLNQEICVYLPSQNTSSDIGARVAPVPIEV